MDGIQYLSKFELRVASIRSKLRYSVFITGSTSTLLSGEMASRLTWRIIEMQVMPFYYSEVVSYIGTDSNGLFADYR